MTDETAARMADREIARIRWSNPNSAQALYGTELTVEPGAVRYVNRLMPSGTTIHEWHSFTDYQEVRNAPTLPLLHHGTTYRIDPEVESSPPGSVLFGVSYFDRFNEQLGSDVLYPPSYSFDYPPECHHYAIRMVNGGCDEVRFSSFAVIEVGADGEQ